MAPRAPKKPIEFTDIGFEPVDFLVKPDWYPNKAWEKELPPVHRTPSEESFLMQLFGDNEPGHRPNIAQIYIDHAKKQVTTLSLSGQEAQRSFDENGRITKIVFRHSHVSAHDMRDHIDELMRHGESLDLADHSFKGSPEWEKNFSKAWAKELERRGYTPEMIKNSAPVDNASQAQPAGMPQTPSASNDDDINSDRSLANPWPNERYSRVSTMVAAPGLNVREPFEDALLNTVTQWADYYKDRLQESNQLSAKYGIKQDNVELEAKHQYLDALQTSVSAAQNLETGKQTSFSLTGLSAALSHVGPNGTDPRSPNAEEPKWEAMATALGVKHEMPQSTRAETPKQPGAVSRAPTQAARKPSAPMQPNT